MKKKKKKEEEKEGGVYRRIAVNFPESTNFDIVQRTRLANRSRDSRGEEAGHRLGDLEISAWPQGTFPRRL